MTVYQVNCKNPQNTLKYTEYTKYFEIVYHTNEVIFCINSIFVSILKKKK